MKTSFLTLIAFHIRDLREEHGVTQAEIAKKLGMTSAGWGKVENGRSSLSVENLLKFCSVLNVQVGDVFLFAERSARKLLSEGWSISYSSVNDDALIEGKGISNMADIKSDTVLGRLVAERVRNSVPDNTADSIVKYALAYVSMFTNGKDK
ncbi:TPA: helix-turn-helix transcriptional regulator [Serratia marcescens]|uniref:helix-turn-helix domain-containing protein n=1 Tax=Serratia marcescens TaxID=615 RepID=UPI0009496EEF|nr:helix-turn-helix transcriptional regulator [Serratia marcescens]HAT4984070.1 helix-turn-helix transcriptional regulator [Serratia marcescens]HAT5031035.1 helix-turn-helix transcriptional regulator [Serratia marcescens]